MVRSANFRSLNISLLIHELSTTMTNLYITHRKIMAFSCVQFISELFFAVSTLIWNGCDGKVSWIVVWI